jgi:hypothetical protein
VIKQELVRWMINTLYWALDFSRSQGPLSSCDEQDNELQESDSDSDSDTSVDCYLAAHNNGALLQLGTKTRTIKSVYADIDPDITNHGDFSQHLFQCL